MMEFNYLTIRDDVSESIKVVDPIRKITDFKDQLLQDGVYIDESDMFAVRVLHSPDGEAQFEIGDVIDDRIVFETGCYGYSKIHYTWMPTLIELLVKVYKDIINGTVGQKSEEPEESGDEDADAED